jgi:hypothetical protein
LGQNKRNYKLIELSTQKQLTIIPIATNFDYQRCLREVGTPLSQSLMQIPKVQEKPTNKLTIYAFPKSPQRL